jgi:putative flippase GtrA
VANLSQYSSETSPRSLRSTVARRKQYRALLLQLLRFGVVGVSNVTIDLLVLNILLLSFPTRSFLLLLIYNSVAYMIGAFNSFVLNKYWTFQQSRTMTTGEVLRFALVNVTGILCNDALLWLAAHTLSMLAILHSNTLLWANSSKLSAIAGTAVITYCGMRLWVFTGQQHKTALIRNTSVTLSGKREE